MWRYSHNHRNPMMFLFGLMLFFGLMSFMFRSGGVPVFIFFFIGGPWIFRLLRQATTSCGTDEADAFGKAKNDDFAKAKNDDRWGEPVDYLTTEDGEVMEVIEERPARRYDDYI